MLSLVLVVAALWSGGAGLAGWSLGYHDCCPISHAQLGGQVVGRLRVIHVVDAAILMSALAALVLALFGSLTWYRRGRRG